MSIDFLCYLCGLQLKAYGHTLPPLGWLFDLQVTLSHLLGLLCSSVLSTKQVRRALPGKKVTEEAKEEEKLVHSDLWKTLFRGGSMVSKLTRSLSGAYYVSKTRDMNGQVCSVHVLWL